MPLGHVAWLSLVLAALVDFLTVVLSNWLERSPFGVLDRSEREAVLGRLLEFTQWGVNFKDHLELRLMKTEEERVKGLHDAPRLFAASSLLTKGSAVLVARDGVILEIPHHHRP
jgi:hypothetical protein